jgi:hypothetical protein
MAEGFVQVSPDSSGKQIDNDVVTIPAGTTVTDGSGNQTTLAAPAFYFRQRVVNADPNNPLAVATVANASGPNPNDFGLSVRLPQGQVDLQTIASILLDIDTNIAELVGTTPFASIGSQTQPQFAIPMINQLFPAQLSPTVPRSVVSDKFGRQVVLSNTIRDLAATQATTLPTGATTETTIITAGATDTFNDIVAIIGANTSATAVRIDIRDQVSTVTVPAGAGILPLYLPAGDTRGITLGGVTLPQTNAGQAWTAQASAAVTDIRIWALYIKNK